LAACSLLIMAFDVPTKKPRNCWNTDSACRSWAASRKTGKHVQCVFEWYAWGGCLQAGSLRDCHVCDGVCRRV
jgi:hypothetical protein